MAGSKSFVCPDRDYMEVGRNLIGFEPLSYHQLHIGNKDWHYQSFGQGDHLLIALHGFGEDSDVYSQWEQAMGTDFTILAVDLPFHGKATDWSDSGFRPADFIRMIQALQAQYGKRDCSLVGHSFGGRILLVILEELGFSPASLWLLAPDGLATRRLGLINTLPAWLRRILAGGLERWRTRWIKLAQGLHSIGLLDAFSLLYLRFHLADPVRRRRLMGVWRSLPYFPVKKKELLRAARNRKLAIHLVIGKTDDLVAWSRVADWLKKWPVKQLHVLDAGHRLINESTASLIAKGIGPAGI